jgi:hypothetical protein
MCLALLFWLLNPPFANPPHPGQNFPPFYPLGHRSDLSAGTSIVYLGICFPTSLCRSTEAAVFHTLCRRTRAIVHGLTRPPPVPILDDRDELLSLGPGSSQALAGEA